MSIFDSFATQSLAPFLTGTMGRPVIYTPKSGTPKSIKAVLTMPPAVPAGTPMSKAAILHVVISHAAVPRVNRGGDIINIGDDVYVVTNILDSQAPATWALEATKQTGR